MNLRIGLTDDLMSALGRERFEQLVLDSLGNHADIEWDFISSNGKSIGNQALGAFDAICLGAPSLEMGDQNQPVRTLLLARLGVGYDHLPIKELTNSGVLVTINPDAIRRPLAAGELGFILTLAHRIQEKNSLTKSGQWAQASGLVGSGLQGKVLASIGAGNVGAELFRLAQPLGMRHLAFDPHVKQDEMAPLGVKLVSLDTLLAEADFLVVNCPLNEKTIGLMDGPAFQKMKPGAFFINAARGKIVDEAALFRALFDRSIAGAALDVFETEPVEADNPLLSLPNVIATPHGLCYTDECLEGMVTGALQRCTELASRNTPKHVINPAALEHVKISSWLRGS